MNTRPFCPGPDEPRSENSCLFVLACRAEPEAPPRLPGAARPPGSVCLAAGLKPSPIPTPNRCALFRFDRAFLSAPVWSLRKGPDLIAPSCPRRSGRLGKVQVRSPLLHPSGTARMHARCPALSRSIRPILRAPPRTLSIRVWPWIGSRCPLAAPSRRTAAAARRRLARQASSPVQSGVCCRGARPRCPRRARGASIQAAAWRLAERPARLRRSCCLMPFLHHHTPQPRSHMCPPMIGLTAHLVGKLALDQTCHGWEIMLHALSDQRAGPDSSCARAGWLGMRRSHVLPATLSRQPPLF